MANELEHRRWNDDAWLEGWLRREVLTDTVTPDVLAHLSPMLGQRVLDVGAGGGRATLAVATAVAPGGEAVGADISEALVDLAQRRAADAQLHNARFVLADVQESAVEGGPFDAAASQFGVMFFDDPVGAFANIRAQLTPGGHMAFACWQAVERNPWFAGSAVVSVVGPPPPPAEGRPPPGPFSLGDPDLITGLLTEAGWADVTIATYEHTLAVRRDVLIDDAQLKYFGVPNDLLGKARAAVEEKLAPLERPDGRYDAPLAYQVVTTRA